MYLDSIPIQVVHGTLGNLRTEHINWLEVKAILLSLKPFVDHICQKHVKILSDNATQQQSAAV